MNFALLSAGESRVALLNHDRLVVFSLNGGGICIWQKNFTRTLSLVLQLLATTCLQEC